MITKKRDPAWHLINWTNQAIVKNKFRTLDSNHPPVSSITTFTAHYKKNPLMLFWQLFSNIQKENNSSGLPFNDAVLLFAQEREKPQRQESKKAKQMNALKFIQGTVNSLYSFKLKLMPFCQKQLRKTSLVWKSYRGQRRRQEVQVLLRILLSFFN